MSLRVNIRNSCRRWLAHLLPECTYITRLLSERRDRRLTLRERLVLALHLRLCVPCSHFGEQIDFIANIVRSDIPTSTQNSFSASAPHLSAEARARIRQCLQNDSHARE